MNRRGFTIVELITVVAIIGILLGIVTTAVSSSIQSARARKADASCTLIQQAFATYKAQKGYWPCFNGGVSGPTPTEGDANVKNNTDLVEIPAETVRQMIKTIVDEAKKGNPLMDVSGLFVATKSGERRSKVRGMDILEALRGTRKNKGGAKLGDLYYGYPEPERGYFRNFRVLYSIPSDTMTVSRMVDESDGL